MDKLAKVRHILKSENLDALVILSDYNRRYISDFTGTSGALIISNNENKLITDFVILNKPQIKPLTLKL